MQPTNTQDPAYFHKVVDCQWACPAHTPVPEYIRLIAQQRYADAYMINWVSNVFPGILGRTCDRPCEPACRRGRVEEENAHEAANSVSAALPTGGFVILDTELNDDLLAEGYARDVIRAVQEARKAAGLEISDRITLKVTVPADDVAKVEQFKDLVAHDTSSDSVSVEAGAELGVEVAKV